MRYLHVVSLRPPAVGLFAQEIGVDATTGLGGLLLLRQTIASHPNDSHAIVCLGNENDAAILSRLGLPRPTIVSSPLRSVLFSRHALERVVADQGVEVLIGWGEAATQAVSACTLPHRRACVDVLQSTARAIGSQASAISFQDRLGADHASKNAPTIVDFVPPPRPTRHIILLLADAATPPALHLALYAMGSLAVAGHPVRVVVPSCAGVPQDTLALLRAQHYLAGLHVATGEIASLAAESDAALLCLDHDRSIGFAATRALVMECVASGTPIVATPASAAMLDLPITAFAPHAARGNHTDLAAGLMEMYDNPQSRASLLEAQWRWCSQVNPDSVPLAHVHASVPAVSP